MTLLWIRVEETEPRQRAACRHCGRRITPDVSPWRVAVSPNRIFRGQPTVGFFCPDCFVEEYRIPLTRILEVASDDALSLLGLEITRLPEVGMHVRIKIGIYGGPGVTGVINSVRTNGDIYIIRDDNGGRWNVQRDDWEVIP